MLIERGETTYIANTFTFGKRRIRIKLASTTSVRCMKRTKFLEHKLNGGLPEKHMWFMAYAAQLKVRRDPRIQLRSAIT